MGQIFQRQPDQLVKYDFLLIMNQLVFTDFFDALEIIDKYYPQSIYLKFDEFEDIFSGVTPIYKEIFDLLSEDSLVVNTFEAIACFTIFSGETYETKCSIIFRLFDLNITNNLDCQGLSRIIPCVCRSLCKLTGLNCPSNLILLQLSAVCFQMMDTDNNHIIDFEEFYIWTVENDELQEFLLFYSGTQTYVYAQKRMSKLMMDIEEKFVIESQKYKNNLLPAQQLQTLLSQVCPQSYLNYLFTIIIDYNIYIINMQTLTQTQYQLQQNKELWDWGSDQKQKVLDNLVIKRFDFLDIMKAWTSYSIVNMNDKSLLLIKELKHLLWVYEEEEPHHFKVNEISQEIDPQRTGQITREQWMNFLCSEDKMFKRALYTSHFKKIFDRYDDDKDGFLQNSKIRQILNDLFKEQMRKIKDMRSVESLVLILDSLEQDIIKEFEDQDLTEFNWFQLHQMIANGTHKYPSLSKLLLTNQ